MSELHAHTLNYEKAYDGYWQALLLAEKSKDSISKADIYIGLGWLYSFYKRNNAAEKYFTEAVNIRHKLIENNKLNSGHLIQAYFSLASLYRVNNKFDKAKIYLDSIDIAQKRVNILEEDHYANAELGYLAVKNGDIDNGLNYLNASASYFETNDISYLVIIYALLGNVYRKLGKLEEGESYFLKSLKISKDYRSHLDYKLFVFDELYKLYLEKNNLKKAIEFQNKARALNEKIYSIKNNQHLFEIKDKYRIEQERQNDVAKQQRIIQLEQEDRIWMLQTVILIVSLIFTTIFSYLTIRNIRNKHKNEKLLIKERQKERLKRHKEVLELKNKELTESALRLIEKDQFIASVKSRLSSQKDSLDVNVIKRILKSMQGNSRSNWSEFEARFTAINQSFYKKLKSQFPELKQTDLKICALVKLNFPSKDMAKLLGISVESVHTSRHRLRKKLGLNRNDNLEEFINSF
ncbi:hypothetical protein MHTCC0001_01980 [Flavobacteriaceae bacterium MHTCC 0001]